MSQILKQIPGQNFTRKQKRHGFLDFLKIDINIGEKVTDFFRGFSNRFTRKKTFYDKVPTANTAAPKQLVTSVRDGVKKLAAPPKKPVNKIIGVSPNTKGPFGGTRKRKQRKQRKQRKH